MTLDQLTSRWQCRPIRNCLGRFVISDAPPDLSPSDLLEPDIPIREFQTPSARDVIVVAQFTDGGLISYKRIDGTYLHTLNTAEGFDRKLAQLGIALPSED